jgi:hypothetical protein
MSAQPDLDAFIAGLPKAELHVHPVGSASPRIVAELAERHGDSALPIDPDALAAYFDFSAFAHFVQLYLSVVDWSGRQTTSHADVRGRAWTFRSERLDTIQRAHRSEKRPAGRRHVRNFGASIQPALEVGRREPPEQRNRSALRSMAVPALAAVTTASTTDATRPGASSSTRCPTSCATTSSPMPASGVLQLGPLPPLIYFREREWPVAIRSGSLALNHLQTALVPRPERLAS